jgi:hypothetical protein
MAWTDLITPDRWQSLGGCNCGGTPRKKYKRIGTDYELQILTTIYQFKLFRSGTLVLVAPLADLQQTLQQYNL